MKRIVMVGTRFDTMGGIASVVNVYRADGLFDRLPITYIATHCDGSNWAKLRIMLSSYFHFMTMLLTGRVGLLHAHVSSRASFWRKTFFFISAFLFRIPTILHLHGSEFAIFYEQECGGMRKFIVRTVFNKVARVLVLSSVWKNWVEKISVNPNVVVIYNPVLFDEKANEWNARKSGAILFLGRLGKRKGSYDLLEAAAKIARTYPEFKLLLGGDGELDQVRRRSLELGIDDKVQLLGWVNGAEKERYLAEAMIYVLPSYNEGLPMSVLEAMAAGLPILSTSIGGIPDAVTEGVEGFLVAPGDIDSLSERLNLLLADSHLARTMGEAARSKVKVSFSSKAILPKLEVLYSEFGLCSKTEQ
jgi:glycosyltransferase involved in cell wall biosynthesis